MGVVPIGGLIRGSAAEQVLAGPDNPFGDVDLAALRAMTVDPDDIAEVFWDLATNRDRAEEIVRAA